MVTRGQSQSLMAPSQPQLTTRDVLGWVENTTRSVMTWWICISGYGKTAPLVGNVKKNTVNNGITLPTDAGFSDKSTVIRNASKCGMTKSFKRFTSKIEIFGHFWDGNLILFNISDRTSMFRTRWQMSFYQSASGTSICIFFSGSSGTFERIRKTPYKRFHWEGTNSYQRPEKTKTKTFEHCSPQYSLSH